MLLPLKYIKKSPTQEGQDFKTLNKYTKKSRGIAETSIESYNSTENLRETERKMVYKFLLKNSQNSYSRQQLLRIFDLPINHITRVVYDLLILDLIEVSHKAKSEYSNKNVEFLTLKKSKLCNQ